MILVKAASRRDDLEAKVAALGHIACSNLSGFDGVVSFIREKLVKAPPVHGLDPTRPG